FGTIPDKTTRPARPPSSPSRSGDTPLLPCRRKSIKTADAPIEKPISPQTATPNPTNLSGESCSPDAPDATKSAQLAGLSHTVGKYLLYSQLNSNDLGVPALQAFGPSGCPLIVLASCGLSASIPHAGPRLLNCWDGPGCIQPP